MPNYLMCGNKLPVEVGGKVVTFPLIPHPRSCHWSFVHTKLGVRAPVSSTIPARALISERTLSCARARSFVPNNRVPIITEAEQKQVRKLLLPATFLIRALAFQKPLLNTISRRLWETFFIKGLSFLETAWTIQKIFQSWKNGLGNEKERRSL